MINFFFRLTHWETWHYLAKYIPISPAWLYYSVRAKSAWFFTPSNPTLTFGGFEGESKMEMYNQLPPGSYPLSILLKHSLTFEDALELLGQNKMSYPFAVKPDIGMMGFLFRKITNKAEFRTYHAHMPVDYIVQHFVPYPLEVSVFYYRYPNEKKGTITGFLKKEFLQLVGDGTSTVGQLIENYPRVRLRRAEMKAKHASKLDHILPKHEVFCLSSAFNLSRGGKLVTLEHEKNEDLLKVFDGLSNYTKHFYYGRYDIKCASIEDLKAGKNFQILEFNGCGAEPHHIYGNGYSLLHAYKIVLHHWNVLSRISRTNHKAGIPYWGFRQGWRFLSKAKKHFALLKDLDLALEA